MKRFLYVAIAMSALVAAPTLALSDSDNDDREHNRRAWYVEGQGDGLCFVRYQQRPVQGVPRKYLSADQAYRALVENPACSISAGQLRQLGYGQ
jgi:hypothetical protein